MLVTSSAVILLLELIPSVFQIPSFWCVSWIKADSKLLSWPERNSIEHRISLQSCWWIIWYWFRLLIKTFVYFWPFGKIVLDHQHICFQIYLWEMDHPHSWHFTLMVHPDCTASSILWLQLVVSGYRQPTQENLCFFNFSKVVVIIKCLPLGSLYSSLRTSEILTFRTIISTREICSSLLF